MTSTESDLSLDAITSHMEVQQTEVGTQEDDTTTPVSSTSSLSNHPGERTEAGHQETNTTLGQDANEDIQEKNVDIHEVDVEGNDTQVERSQSDEDAVKGGVYPFCEPRRSQSPQLADQEQEDPSEVLIAKKSTHFIDENEDSKKESQSPNPLAAGLPGENRVDVSAQPTSTAVVNERKYISAMDQSSTAVAVEGIFQDEDEDNSVGSSREVATKASDIPLNLEQHGISIDNSTNSGSTELPIGEQPGSQDSAALSLPDFGTESSSESEEVDAADFTVPPASHSQVDHRDNDTDQNVDSTWANNIDGEGDWNEALNIKDFILPTASQSQEDHGDNNTDQNVDSSVPNNIDGEGDWDEILNVEDYIVPPASQSQEDHGDNDADQNVDSAWTNNIDGEGDWDETLNIEDFIVPPKSWSQEAQRDSNTDQNVNLSSANIIEGGGDWDEMLNVEDVEEEELKATQLQESPDTATSSSAASNDTIVTEAAGTDTTSDTEDSISTAEDGMGLQDEDDELEQHSIMPQQPDIFVTTVGLDAAPRSGVEEEKTEVDAPEEKQNLEVLLAIPEPPTVEPSPAPPDDAHIVPPIIENKRAEYVSVTVLKFEANYQHGLEFMMVDRELRVSHIIPDALFANSPLAAFDKMLRVNDLNVERLDPINASHLLDVLTGSVTVIAQNPGGVADLVESQITKPLSDSRPGIEFTEVCTDEALSKHHLEIARIGEKSLFSAALLHVGDVVLAINDCNDVDLHTGNLLLSTAPKRCVVLARTKLKTQMAIARRPTHQLPPGFNFVRAMEEARRQREELRRKQGCYYNSCERPGACANIFQWLGNVYVIVIVIVGIGISWQKIKEETIDGSDAVGTILQFAFLFVGGIILGFLVNAPWWFRRVGARFSIAQLVVNVIVIVSFFILMLVLDSGDIVADEDRQAIFFSLFFPLLIIVNLPSVFVKREDGSDGNTISDRSPSDDGMSDATVASDLV